MQGMLARRALALRAVSDQPDESSTTRWYLAFAAPFVLVAFVVLVIVLILGASWYWALLAAVAVATLIAAALFLAADRLTSKLIGASSPGVSLHPRLSNMVDELCVRAGVSQPTVLMVNSDVADAVAFGRSPLAPSLAVTNGLVNSLSVVELEAVIARELSRVRSGDVKFDTLAVALIRLPLAPLGALGRRLVGWARGDDRVVRDDLAGVGLTRYPPGLSSALSTMESQAGSSPGSALTDHLWTRATPSLAGVSGRWSLAERIALLQEL